MVKKFSFYFFIFSPLMLLILASGCSWLQNKEELTKKKEEQELKNRNYTALEEKVLANTLAKGTAAETIKYLFGEPDDIFHSSSNISTFQIWTYNEVVDRTTEMGWHSIRLYFDDNKLVSWKY